ncbi:MAG: hypothetical protein VW934_07300 [Alphaproteobacteria bacterium]
MTTNPPNALVPAGKKSLPVVRDNSAPGGYRLASENIHLASREEVKNRLPDILGKALALIWVDREFHDRFSRDPQSTLEAQGIFLPDNVVIEFQKPNSDRPRIVVYETRPNSIFRTRIFYLQLVLMAGS